MVNPNAKLRLAQGLAVAAATSFLIFALGTSNGVLPTAGRGLIFPVMGIILSAAAFILSWKQKSILVSALLVAGGTLQAINAIAATGNFAILVFPGPISGVIVGLTILGLGIAKSISTANALRNRNKTTS